MCNEFSSLDLTGIITMLHDCKSYSFSLSSLWKFSVLVKMYALRYWKQCMSIMQRERIQSKKSCKCVILSYAQWNGLAVCVLLQPLLTAQQLASAVAGVMPGGTPALNQPILIPFNMAGQLGGQQGLVLTLPTANLTNIQGLVAAAAAGGIMTLPLQNLQGKSCLVFF